MKLKHVTEHPFLRNVIAVASGTAMAQAITMAFSPIITRLYGPEVFGIQGVFVSIASILATIAALTFPIAIVLPKSEREARGIAILSMYVGMVMFVITTLLIWWYGKPLLVMINSEAISNVVYLLPVFMVFSVFSTIIGQWLIRKQAFGVTGKANVWQALVINGVKACAGTFNPSASMLVTTHTFGNLVLALLLFKGMNSKVDTLHSETNVVKTLTLLDLAKKYKDFPLLRAPQVFINAISHSSPVVMLAMFFGPAAVGFYALANSVLGIPSTLIGGSVSQVFYPKANEAHQAGKPLDHLIFNTTMGMAILGALPFLLVILFGPYLFELVFGSRWEMAGVYAEWLSGWLFFNYINKPAVAAIPILGLQQGFLIYEIFSAGTKFLAIAIGYYWFKSDVVAVALFAVCGMVAYFYLIVWVITEAKLEYVKTKRKMEVESVQN